MELPRSSPAGRDEARDSPPEIQIIPQCSPRKSHPPPDWLCAICHESEVDTYAHLDGCAHVFCANCILVWSMNINTCPSCRARFTLVQKTHSLQRPVETESIRRDIIRIQDKTQDGEEWWLVDEDEDEEDEEHDAVEAAWRNILCRTCHGGQDEDVMLLCDACDAAYHTFCVGRDRIVPDGEWFCPTCSGEERGAGTRAARNDNEGARAVMQPQRTLARRRAQARAQAILAAEAEEPIRRPRRRRRVERPQNNNVVIVLEAEDEEEREEQENVVVARNGALQPRRATQRAEEAVAAAHLNASRHEVRRVALLRADYEALRRGTLRWEDVLPPPATLVTRGGRPAARTTTQPHPSAATAATATPHPPPSRSSPRPNSFPPPPDSTAAIFSSVHFDRHAPPLPSIKSIFAATRASAPLPSFLHHASIPRPPLTSRSHRPIVKASSPLAPTVPSLPTLPLVRTAASLPPLAPSPPRAIRANIKEALAKQCKSILIELHPTLHRDAFRTICRSAVHSLYRDWKLSRPLDAALQNFHPEQPAASRDQVISAIQSALDQYNESLHHV